MRQVLTVGNVLFLGFLLAYAVSFLGIAYMFWRNRRDEKGELNFGFVQLAGHFLCDAFFLLIFVAGLTALSRPTTPTFRWWIISALVVRAIGAWPLAFKYAIIPRPSKD